MEKKNKTLILRILFSAIGLTICGLGVGIFLFAGLGVDSASVFETGLSNVIGLSFGTTTAIINVVILAVVFAIDRKYINISSLLAIFLIGYVGEYTGKFLDLVMPGGAPLVLGIVFALIACVIMGIGIAMYIAVGLGVGAIDLLSEIISDRTKFQYRWVRVTIDVLFVVTGWLMGGQFGAGTILIAFGLGPVVQFVRPAVVRMVEKATGYSERA